MSNLLVLVLDCYAYIFVLTVAWFDWQKQDGDQPAQRTWSGWIPEPVSRVLGLDIKGESPLV